MRLYNFSQFLKEAKNPCWTGYRQIGTKNKKGRKVPNCVPVKESDDEKTYSFDELTPEAQENAISLNREKSIEGFDWWEDLTSKFENELSEIGLTDFDIQFSGFNSQGDGASFTGRVIDNKKFLTALELNPFRGKNIGLKKFDDAFDEFCENIYITIQRDRGSRYYHENTISALVEPDGEDEITIYLTPGVVFDFSVSKLSQDIEEEITEWARKKSKSFYRELENYYDELTSDESIKSELEDGDYEFDESGNIV